MRVNWIIKTGTDHCKDGSRPYGVCLNVAGRDSRVEVAGAGAGVGKGRG